MKRMSSIKVKTINDLNLYILNQNYGKTYTRFPFRDLTTLKIGGNIRLLFYPNSEQALLDVLSIINRNKFKYFLIGNGSNVLANDNYFDGVVIKLKDMNDYIRVNDDVVEVGAGLSIAKVIFSLMKYNLGGLEFLIGVPASVGGLICMNAGAFKENISDYLLELRVINKEGKIENIKREKLKFSYRTSSVKDDNMIVLSAKFKLVKSNREEIKNKIKKYLGLRKERQPLDTYNAGSTFKNSIVNSAKLIDECNLKGFNFNDAYVSNKHANFLINSNKASAFDMIRLIYYIKDVVRKEKGVELECEWVFINFDFEENVV